MENLAELLKKYYGYGMNDPLSSNEQADSEMGLGQDIGLQNKSLLGSDKKTNNTLSLMGLLGSPEALTGLGLISAGMKGQNIGEAALPSFVEGLKVSSAVRSLTKEQEQQKAIDEFGSQVPEQYKPLFKAFPRETMKLLLTPKSPTLSGEGLRVASKLQGLNPTEFKEAFKKLSKVEQDLYNNQIRGKQDQLSALGIDLSEIPQPSSQTKAKTSNIPTLEEYVKQNKIANPSFTEEEILEFYKKKYK